MKANTKEVGTKLAELAKSHKHVSESVNGIRKDVRSDFTSAIDASSKKGEAAARQLETQMKQVTKTVGEVKSLVEALPARDSVIRGSSSEVSPVPPVRPVNVLCPFWNMVVDAMLSNFPRNARTIISK